MGGYQHILIGLDLTEPDAATISKRAQQLAQQSGAKISLVHVIEPLTFAYSGDIPVDLGKTQDLMVQQAQRRLMALVDELGIQPDTVQVALGPTADELRRTASSVGADLIVVGSHGRHGLALLLGSTASHVLRGAECDVLAVRV